MDTNVTVPGPSILEAARGAVIEQAAKTGEILTNYAKTLNSVFGAEWWNLKGKDARGLKAERDAFKAGIAALTKPDGTPRYAKGSIDVMWQRVKEEAGYVTTGNRVQGGTDVDSKTLAELKTMINRILKAEEDGQDPEASAVKGKLIECFVTLGGEADDLG